MSVNPGGRRKRTWRRQLWAFQDKKGTCFGSHSQ